MRPRDEEYGSEDEYDGSESFSRPARRDSSKMRLRHRRSKKPSQYNDYEPANDDDSEEECRAEVSGRGTRGGRSKPAFLAHQLEIDRELDRMEYEEQLKEHGLNDDDEDEEEFGVFNPAVDCILWRRLKKEAAGQSQFEYLVKLKEYSYLHCQWMGGDELAELGKATKNKLNRFNKVFDQKILERVGSADQEIDPFKEDNDYFDPSYVKVDKILKTAEIFPVVHSKKANEIKGKWSELVSRVVSKLLNYSKDGVPYGIYFMEPVNPEADNCPDYKKVVLHAMDLGTLSNRIYLDYYKSFGEVWRDLGHVFKNCRLYNANAESDIRVLGDTLREYAKLLYRQWHRLQSDKYREMVAEVGQKKAAHLAEHQDVRARLAAEVAGETSEFLARLFEATDRGMEVIERSDVERCDRESLKAVKSQYIKEISYHTNYFLEDGYFISQVTKDLDRIFSLSLGFSIEPAKAELARVKQLVEDKVKQSVDVLAERRFELYITSKLNLPTVDEMAMFNPGEFSYAWLKESDDVDVENEEFVYFEDEEVSAVDLMSEIDRLYLVKWTNLSYLDSTWETESVIDSPSHINEYRAFNRAHDKESRVNYIDQLARHRNLVELMNNPKKRSKTPYQTVNDYKNKLYNLDIAKKADLFQYSPKNQPIFKHKKMLRSYQLESVNWLIESWYHCRNVILADEMGLGKTIQSIAFLNYLYSFQNMKGPFLVIAPLSTLQHWKRTVEDWSTMNCVLYYDVNGVEGRSSCRWYEWFHTDISVKGALVRSAELCKFNVLITSFEVFLQDMKDVLVDLPFQHIIIDEAHRLKNQNAKILGALRRLPCERILLLTGTPVQNNTAELWTLLNFIEPSKFYSADKFLQEFGDLSNAEQIDKLHQVLKPYLLRRMKDDVEKSIPPLQETIIDIELTNIQKTLYKALYENNKGVLAKGSGFNFNASMNNLEMQLRKCCNHPFLMREMQHELTKECHSQAEYIQKLISCSGKMVLLDKLIDKIMREGSKVLIFSQFTHMLLLVEEYLKCKNVGFEKIDGSVKAKERQNAIDRFNSGQSRVNVFLLSTKAGGVGINLTAANVVIIFDSDWNPQNDVQATARAHRIGQENSVQVFRLITKKTYEAEMFERASKKLGLDQAIFLGGAFHQTTKPKGEDENLKKLSKNEIEILLKKGIMGFLEEEEEAGQAEQDIDEIIKNSRVAKYSLINGTYTFSKSTFNSSEADTNLQMDDPNFWDIVFKNSESECEKLEKAFSARDGAGAFADTEAQKEFLRDLSKLVHKLIDSKIRVENYSVDDENKLSELLTRVTSHPHFHKEYKNYAFQMISEIQKPSRRCKNIDINKLDVTLDLERMQNPAKKKAPAAAGEQQDDEDDSLIFKEASDDEANIFERDAGRQRDRLPKKKPLGAKPDAAEKEPAAGQGKTGGQVPAEGAAKKKKKPTASIVNELPEQKPNAKHREPAAKKKEAPGPDRDRAAKKEKEAKAPRPESVKKKVKSLVAAQNGNGACHAKEKEAAAAPKKDLPVFTYDQLKLSTPSSVDYTMYKKDWCRFCGARYSSKFWNGPW